MVQHCLHLSTSELESEEFEQKAVGSGDDTTSSHASNLGRRKEIGRRGEGETFG